MASALPRQPRLDRPLSTALFELAQQAPDAHALFLPDDGRVTCKTWRQLADDVLRMTAHLDRVGVQPADRVALWSDNRYEWIVVDLAIQLVGAVNVPLHGSLPASTAAAQISHSEANYLFASNATLRNGLAEQPLATSAGRLSVELLDASGGEPSLLDRISGLSVDDGMEAVEQHWARFDPQANATILYSSGTTGEPKGVVLTHENLFTNAYAVTEVLEESPSIRRMNFLPFSHIYARTCDLYTWLAGGSQLVLASSRETVFADCQLTKPTLMNAVPFFYQRIAQKVAESERTSSPTTIQELLGGNIWACISGGAPLPVETFDFFHERGVMLLPGYGLTESSPVITVGTPKAYRRGAVGKAIPGIEVRIADDGELLTRGPHVMREYWKEPELTRQTIRDGWLYTGDLGAIDADGFISVTGRKKELIALSTGKKAIPTYIEGLLLGDPLILQAMVVGNDKPCLTALIVPNFDLLGQWIDQEQVSVQAAEDALAQPQVVQLFAERIRHQLQPLPACEQVKRFYLLKRPFTLEEGHLTQKLSLRRDVLNRHFGLEIAALYDGGGVAIEYENATSRA
jgi:long-chain acyl-CoA synthetase